MLFAAPYCAPCAVPAAAGLSVQPTPTSAVLTLQHVGNGTPAGEIILDTTIPGSVFVESGPDAGTRVQPGRYIIRSTGMGRGWMGAHASACVCDCVLRGVWAALLFKRGG